MSDAETQRAADETTGDDEAVAPRDELREGLLATMAEALGDKLIGSHIEPGRELWVRVEPAAWVEAAELARDRLGCAFFDFLSALDWLPSPWGRYEDDNLEVPARPHAGDPGYGDFETGHAGGDTRFQVFARVANVHEHHSVVLKTDLPGDEPGDDGFRIDSLVPVYAGANWHERECWEMFGITFDGHPDMRHLYLPSEFEGHPLRKDFPLLARVVRPWPGVVDVEPMPEPAEPPRSGDNGSSGGDAGAGAEGSDESREEASS